MAALNAWYNSPDLSAAYCPSQGIHHELDMMFTLERRLNSSAGIQIERLHGRA